MKEGSGFTKERWRKHVNEGEHRLKMIETRGGRRGAETLERIDGERKRERLLETKRGQPADKQKNK